MSDPTQSKTLQVKLEWLKQFANETLIPWETKNPHSQEFNFDLVEGLHAQDLLHVITPKSFGGLDASVVDLIEIVKTIGYGSPSLAATFIGNLLGYSAVIMYAEPDLRDDLCKNWSKKPDLWSFGMTEANVGSDLKQIKTHAFETESGYIIEGEKNYITNASYSKNMAVFANTFDKDKKPLGVSCFYIPGDTNGLSRGAIMDKICWKKANTGTIKLEKVKVPKKYLLGKTGDGLKILTHCLNRSKTLLGALGVGISYRALDLATERLNATERYSRPLLDQPRIRHELARHFMNVEASWLLTKRAAEQWDSGKPAVKEASMAKLFSGATAKAAADCAQELFGARGLFNDFEVSRLQRDAKGIEVIEGPSFVQELLIAREVLPKRTDKKATEKDDFKLTSSDMKRAS